MNKDKIIIDKKFLKEYKTLLIGLENCDAYEISVTDILDIYCEVTLIGKKGKLYRTDDGFIKIAARASNTVESWVLREKEMGTEWDHRLRERLEMCKSGVDMTSFSLRAKKKGEMDIYVPYDPLEDIMHGSEIELSNCPSLEIDGEGNMIIAFGKSSKQPKRKDNNYHEIITGWKKAFGDYLPKTLRVATRRFSNFGNKQQNFLFYFNILDKNCKKKFAEFVFMDCKSMRMEMFFPEKGDCEIVMSRMADGRIYVGLDGMGIDFTCASVIEYDCYCNRLEK